MTRFRKSAIPTILSLSILTLSLLPLAGCRGGIKALVAKFHHRKSKSKPNTTDYADNVSQVVESPQLTILKWPDYTNVQPAVKQFYDDRNYELAWTRDGKPTDATTALIAQFTGADKKGLRPEDYDASRWAERVAKLETIRKANDTSDDAQNTVAQFDAAVTIAAMRYVSDLHVGRVNPQALNFDIDVPAKRAAFDLATFVNDQLVDADDVVSTVATIEPQNPIYAATEKALPVYLTLLQQQGKTPLQPLPPAEKPVAPGGSYAGLQPLVARLQLEGDLTVPQPAQTYDAGLSAAVQHYQQRHGITPDGKLSQQTIDSMNVPLAVRVQQLDDALERWRWMPDNFVNPRVFANLPEFIVRTYEPDKSLAFKMKVVDGEANGHDTPMFVRTMRFLIFRPYWNLPTSIVKKELMKHFDKGGEGYLASHDYEVTTTGGEVAKGWTAEDLEHSRYLVRQKPGPKNSLGLVKFMFPNEYDIYMHSTPEMNLFNLTRRDRSHGCVRLNDAEKMANWVLTGQSEWDADKIHDAMFGGDENNNKQVNLKVPLPVVIGYFTAMADEDGSVHFYDDIYGYDKELEAALAKPRPYDWSEKKINPKLTPGETE